MSPSSTASPAAATTFHTFATISARISSAIARTSRLNALVRPAARARCPPAAVRLPCCPPAAVPAVSNHEDGAPAAPGDPAHPRRTDPEAASPRGPPPGTAVRASAPVALHAVPVRRPARRRGGDMAKKARKKKARKKSAANHGKRPNS
ncbi:hypothetical protein Athai_44100 [Actinocatenispora thailandica]|uniref:Uncharacterized protein n=1 Tax=Actinocatenispora thailandica TaxID=227318 RepID=A0A7R7HY39_9ACTN|nr:hypothetical protein Athai_44100 [Actinocatenispora thailandica]